MRKQIAWLVPIFYTIILLALGLLQTWFPSTKSWIEVTKIGLSLPVLLVIFLSSIIYLYEEPIRAFISKIKGIHTDKIKIDTQQDHQDTNSIPIEAVHSFMALRDSEWQKSFDEVAAAANLAIKEKDEVAQNLSNLIKDLQEKVYTVEYERIKWHFRYADRFLVGRTKMTLKIISLSTPVSPDALWDKFENLFNTIEERDAVLSALIDLNFVEEQLNEYYVTKTGELYIGFIEQVYKVDWKILMDVLVNPRRADVT